MKTRRITLSIIFLFVLVTFFACATAESQYEGARKINTISAYQEFLSKNPSGKYAKDAKTCIDALNFEKAKSVNSVSAYQSFINSSNSELFKNYAIQRIQKIYSEEEYVRVKESDTVEAYDTYMKKYPQSIYLNDCRLRIDYLEWSRAIKGNDAVSYYKYLNNCTSCDQHDKQARDRFKIKIKSGVVMDLSMVKNRIRRIMNRSDIVVMQVGSNNISSAQTISTQTGKMKLEDLSTADQVLVNILKDEKSISSGDLLKGKFESVRKLRLKNRVPISDVNTIGFNTIIIYSEEKESTDVIFIADGKGYYFKETDKDIY